MTVQKLFFAATAAGLTLCAAAAPIASAQAPRKLIPIEQFTLASTALERLSSLAALPK